MHTFNQLGEKYAFPPFFYPLSIIFFPQPVIWGGGVKQKNIHPWPLTQPGNFQTAAYIYLIASFSVCFLSKWFLSICSDTQRNSHLSHLNRSSENIITILINCLCMFLMFFVCRPWIILFYSYIYLL